PELLQFRYLFLLFEVECHIGILSSLFVVSILFLLVVHRRATSAATWPGLTWTCSPPSRSGFTATTCFAASSSPTITAWRAPLASARFICDLKLPPPQWNTTATPRLRRSCATFQANRSAASPLCTR